MMAASMKKNSTKAATRAPPRRSVRILEKQFMWDCLRNTQDVMRSVYSFLSVYDRVHLAEVDKTFQNDAARGQVVGIYGDEGLDLFKAFETIKKWHDFEMSPRYQMDVARAFYVGDYIAIKAEWYTPSGGWDFDRIMVRRKAFLFHYESYENTHTILLIHSLFPLIMSHSSNILMFGNPTRRTRPLSSIRG